MGLGEYVFGLMGVVCSCVYVYICVCVLDSSRCVRVHVVRVYVRVQKQMYINIYSVHTCVQVCACV